MKNVKKIALPIVILIIMIGAVVTATVGFKFSLMYQAHKRIEVYIDKDYKVEEVADIVKEETATDNIIKQDVETFEKDVSFTVKSINKTQEKNLEKAINEKYELKDADSVVVITEPHMRLSDIMKPYVKPLVISSIIICAYLVIRFRKTGILNCLCMPISALIIAEALYFSLIAILRIPVSNITMPISLAVYIATSIAITLVLKRKNADVK